MKSAYVVSPFLGITEKETRENMQRTKRYCGMVFYGYRYVPVAPSIYFPQFLMGNTHEQADFLTVGMKEARRLIASCDVALVFADTFDGATEEMRKDIELAIELGLTVTYVTKETVANWLKVYEKRFDFSD